MDEGSSHMNRSLIPTTLAAASSAPRPGRLGVGGTFKALYWNIATWNRTSPKTAGEAATRRPIGGGRNRRVANRL